MIAGTGDPVAVIATAPAWLSVKSATEPLVMAGAADALTVMVTTSVAVLPEALLAEMVTG